MFPHVDENPRHKKYYLGKQVENVFIGKNILYPEFLMVRRVFEIRKIHLNTSVCC